MKINFVRRLLASPFCCQGFCFRFRARVHGEISQKDREQHDQIHGIQILKVLPSATCQSTRWRSLETNPWTGEELVCCSICRFFDCVINPFFAKRLEFPWSLTARPLRPKKNGQSEKDSIIFSIKPRGKNHKRPIFRGSTLRNFSPSSSGWVLWSYPGRLRRTRTPARKRRTGCHLAIYQKHPKKLMEETWMTTTTQL